jgi:hypothetical protein
MVAKVNDRETRAANREHVNAILRAAGLAEFENEFPSWNSRPHKFEIEDVVAIDTETNPRYVALVTFSGITAQGEPGRFTMRYPPQSARTQGVVVIIRIKIGKRPAQYVLVRQYRNTAETHLTELIRSFPARLDDPLEAQTASLLQVRNLPVRCVVDEVGEEVIRVADVRSNTWIGRFPENTGDSRVNPDVWYFNIRVPEAVRGIIEQACKEPNDRGLQLQMVSLQNLVEMYRTRQLVDAHTTTALTMFFSHFNLWDVIADPSKAEQVEQLGLRSER